MFYIVFLCKLSQLNQIVSIRITILEKVFGYGNCRWASTCSSGVSEGPEGFWIVLPHNALRDCFRLKKYTINKLRPDQSMDTSLIPPDQ